MRVASGGRYSLPRKNARFLGMWPLDVTPTTVNMACEQEQEQEQDQEQEQEQGKEQEWQWAQEQEREQKQEHEHEQEQEREREQCTSSVQAKTLDTS